MLVAIGAAVAVITGIGAGIGIGLATGLAKLFSQPFVPFALIPATSTSKMLMIEVLR